MSGSTESMIKIGLMTVTVVSTTKCLKEVYEKLTQGLTLESADIICFAGKRLCLFVHLAAQLLY